MRFTRLPLVALALAFGVALPLSTSSCWLFTPTGLDGFVEAFIRADCKFAYSCCTAPERQQFFTRNFRDEGACIQESLEEGSGANIVVDRAKAVIAAGKGEFNQERATECLTPLLEDRNSCNAEAVLGGGALDVVCAAEQARGFVVGNVEDGDDCNDDIECADFGVCDRSDNEADVITTAGECKAARPEGEECIDDDGNVFACFPGTACVGDADGNFTCEEQELLDNGEDCFVASQCESNFCEQRSEFRCGISDAPCTVETVAVDCPDLGDFCFEDTASVCADSDVSFEACDGQ
jgi:hypothetical protein